MAAAKRKSPVAGLPPKLEELVEAIGFSATLKLVDRWGGVRLYVPLEEHLTPEHAIVKELGAENAAKLARTHNEWLEVPRAARYLRMVRNRVIRETGTSASRLARKFSMTRRNIFYIRAAEEAEQLQLDLFAEDKPAA
jgi:hypothetical protein